MLSLLKPLINQGKRTTRIDEHRNITSQTWLKAIQLVSRLREIPIAKRKSRNSAWITINRRISPLPPRASNMISNNDGNGADTPSDNGDISSTIDKVSPPKEPGNDAQFEKSRGS
ncbi:MAG TPA: hypothetical protein VFY68_16910 [Nitrososphaeraceae archaeon]|nr:hypothetical protein [Nitrososphaeraceae archaeon]